MADRQAIRDKIWDLLETRPEVAEAFKAGNRIKISHEGWLRKKSRAAPNDFPHIEISDGRATHSGFVDSKSFAMESATFLDDGAAAGDWVVHRTFTYTFTITSKTVDGSDLDELEDLIHSALIQGGPRLGLITVTQWGPIVARPREVENKPNGKMLAIFDVPVTSEVSGRDLLPT